MHIKLSNNYCLGKPYNKCFVSCLIGGFQKQSSSSVMHIKHDLRYEICESRSVYVMISAWQERLTGHREALPTRKNDMVLLTNIVAGSIDLCICFSFSCHIPAACASKECKLSKYHVYTVCLRISFSCKLAKDVSGLDNRLHKVKIIIKQESFPRKGMSQMLSRF